MRKTAAALALLVASALIGLPGPASADGTEALGPPSIAIAEGSGIAAGGVGLKQSQPRNLTVEVPGGATVKQVLLYWEGQSKAPDPGDNTIEVEGIEVTGTTIGGPTVFFKAGGVTPVNTTSFRADITDLGLVQAGPNTLSVGGLSFNFANNGAGILVIYQEGSQTAFIAGRDGNDNAFVNFKPPLNTTVPQTFTFDPAGNARTANLTLMVSSVAPNRPNAVKITVDGTTTTLVNAFGDLQGPEWDTKTFPVDIPPGATTVTVQVLSQSDGTSRLPASITWTSAYLAVPAGCPVAPGVDPASHGSAYGLDIELLDQTLIGERPKASTQAPGGPAEDSAAEPEIAVPSVATVKLPVATSKSSLTPNPSSTATATTLGVNLLAGAITATAVHGVSQSSASPDAASYNSTGSHIANLKINGSPVTSIAPNKKVLVKNPLLPTQTLAEVVLYEETGSSSLGSGKAEARHSVNMIHVTLLKPFGPLTKGSEIIVAHAESDALSPADPCPSTKSVSGRAFTAFAEGRLGAGQEPIATVQVGDASLPPTGGADDTHVLLVTVPPAVLAASGHDTTSGSLAPNPNATARSVVKSANLLGGVVTADVLDVRSTSSADGTTAGTTFGVTFLNLVVNGNPIAASPPPNTTIAIPQPGGELVLIVLNEQVVNTNGTTDTDGTVNAIHAYVFNNSGALEGEVIVASAHSDAHV
ncbi:MAG: choice-of-anchor P family protein [Micromonosporaceae bacterium]